MSMGCCRSGVSADLLQGWSIAGLQGSAPEPFAPENRLLDHL